MPVKRRPRARTRKAARVGTKANSETRKADRSESCATRTYQSEIRAAAADETRARIVAAARALLNGGKGTPTFSLDGVARQAGVTRLTVYNQFGSRRGLLEAVFDDLARQSRLFEIPTLLASEDAREALRQFVALFCRFWTLHGPVIAKLNALARLDEEVATSLRARTERRRRGLSILVSRCIPHLGGQRLHDLVDVVYALTSYEMFEHLSVRQRGRDSVEEILQNLIAAALERYGVGRSSRT